MTGEKFLYRRISERLLEQISAGSFQVGEKLPSVRTISRLFKVSVNTAMQSYRQLEALGFLEIRPQSGAYVRSSEVPATPAPDGSCYSLLPAEVSLSQDVLRYMEPHARPGITRLGIALPGPDLQPVKKVMDAVRDAARQQPLECWDYMHPNGHPLLTHCLARRSLLFEVPVAADDIIVTAGAMEALSLAVRSVSRPGDTVAVESPTYYGTLLMLETHHRRVIEIPTHPQNGIDLEALEKVMARGELAACIVSTNAQNPLGFTMTTSRKRALVQLAEKYDVPVIENDVWGDTVFSADNLPAKAFDRTGLVLYCNSFSKTLVPGLRLGWALPGRFQNRFRELKQLSTIAACSISQIAVAELLESGCYESHIRTLRASLQTNVGETTREVLRSFPAGTRINQPSGGCVLWIQLPQGVDGLTLFELAADRGIHVFPGGVFSLGGKHADFLRINAGNPLTETLRRGLQLLGESAADLIAGD